MEENKEKPVEIKIGDEFPLDKINIGMSGVITKVDGEGKIKRRLFDMGLTPGAELFLRKKAPLGDPLEITLRGYELTLRKEEALHVIVRVTDLKPMDKKEIKEMKKLEKEAKKQEKLKKKEEKLAEKKRKAEEKAAKNK